MRGWHNGGERVPVMILDGKYYRELRKGEVVGVVGAGGKESETIEEVNGSGDKEGGNSHAEEERKTPTPPGKQDSVCREALRRLQEEALCCFDEPGAPPLYAGGAYWKEVRWERKGIEEMKYSFAKDGMIDRWRTSAEGETIIQV